MCCSGCTDYAARLAWFGYQTRRAVVGLPASVAACSLARIVEACGRSHFPVFQCCAGPPQKYGSWGSH